MKLPSGMWSRLDRPSHNLDEKLKKTQKCQEAKSQCVICLTSVESGGGGPEKGERSGARVRENTSATKARALLQTIKPKLWNSDSYSKCCCFKRPRGCRGVGSADSVQLAAPGRPFLAPSVAARARLLTGGVTSPGGHQRGLFHPLVFFSFFFFGSVTILYTKATRRCYLQI